jgi:hypothetical protein
MTDCQMTLQIIGIIGRYLGPNSQQPFWYNWWYDCGYNDLKSPRMTIIVRVP